MTIKARILAAAALCLALPPAAVAGAAPHYAVVDRLHGADGGWDYASVDAARARLYVARTDAVMEVDLKTGKVVDRLASARRAHAVLPIPGTGLLLETDGNSGLARFVSGDTGAVLAELATGRKPDAAFFDPATGLVGVMNGDDGTVSLLDPATRSIVGAITVGGVLEAGAPDGKGLAYVNVEDKGMIAVIDLRARTLLRSIAMPGCEEPSGIALVADGTRLISACANGKAMVVDPVAGTVVATLAIGRGPDAVIADPARGLAFIPSGGTGTLAVIDTRQAKAIRVLASVPTQVGARTGALDPTTGRLYLPAATLGATAPGAKRGAPVPGSFVILVVAPGA
ncbi:MAG: YncE family protein [Pseudomonadota bacterium]